MVSSFSGGGSGGGSGFSIEVRVPTIMRLRFDSERVLARIGNRLAANARAMLKTSRTYEGSMLPTSADDEEDDGGPIDLNETGELLSKIRWDRKTQSIRPVGKHSRASKRAGSAYGLLAILMSGRGRNRQRVREEFDPFGTGAQGKIYEDAAAFLQTAIDREIASGKSSLIGEAYRTYKISKKKSRG